MKKRDTTDNSVLPEQYELLIPPAFKFSLKRRSFFKVLGSGLAAVFSISRSIGHPGHQLLTDDDQLSAWIHINQDGKVTIFTGKAEVGQNIRTSLAQVVAEELPVAFESIEMVMGDTALTPYDRGTFGSRSTPYMGPQLRKAAATTRELLLERAAKQWNTVVDELRFSQGTITWTSTNKSVSIGELTKGQELLFPIRPQVKLKGPDQWSIAGKSIPKVNGVTFLTGAHKFVSDMKLPGMFHGKVLRAPAFGAKLARADTSRARAMKDVVVIEDGYFIAVAAPSLSVARSAISAIETKWSFEPQPSRKEIFAYLKKKSQESEHAPASLANRFVASSKKVDATFQVDYIAHVPLEPRAGLARWDDGKLTVWTGTQRPFGVQEELAEVFNLPKESVRVIQPDTGSGYGGKHTGEAGIEAARIARECNKPVKVVWTRDEEFNWAYFRPAGVIDVRASVTEDGLLDTWEFHNYNSGGAGIETPYSVTEKFVRFHASDSPLRQGSYRALAATANNFARESVMDDLALAIHADPLAFRIRNLAESRMKDVLNAAAEAFGWSQFRTTQRSGKGIACGTEKASYVATCADVTVQTNGTPTVNRIVVAFECGAIINPEHLKSQVQGAVIQGLGGALFERIDFENGKLLNGSMSRYRVPRFKDTPKIDVVLVNRNDIDPAGAGETPIIAVAPAIRNAILNASGKPIYSLPLL